MIINKKAALTFLVCDITLVAIRVFLHFYLKDGGAGDSNGATENQFLYLEVIQVAETILTISIYVGVIWILKIFNEKLWIKAAAVFFTVLQIITLLFTHVFVGLYISFLDTVSGIIYLANLIALIYLLAAFIVVKTKHIKVYLICFAVLMLLSFAWAIIGSLLSQYLHINIESWLNNEEVFVNLSIADTLIMFLMIYNMANRKAMVA